MDIEIYEHHLSAQLVIISLRGFDVILAKNWFYVYYANIDFRKKQIQLLTHGMQRVEFEAQKASRANIKNVF